MTVLADLHVPGDSWLHRADPRVKLLFAAAAIAVLLLYDNLAFMAVALAALHALHRSAGVPWDRIVFVWKALAPVVVLIAVLWTVFYPVGPAFATFGVVELTAHALAKGLAIGLRIVTMALAVFAWLYTTRQAHVVRSLVKLGFPFEWGLVLALALRYIPTFQSTYATIVDAQRARGLEISGSGFARVRRLLPVFVSMLIATLRASEQLAIALEARAVGAPGIARTCYRDIRFRPADHALAALVIAGSGVLVYLNRVFGFGTDPIALVG